MVNEIRKCNECGSFMLEKLEGEFTAWYRCLVCGNFLQLWNKFESPMETKIKILGGECQKE